MIVGINSLDVVVASLKRFGTVGSHIEYVWRIDIIVPLFFKETLFHQGVSNCETSRHQLSLATNTGECKCTTIIGTTSASTLRRKALYELLTSESLVYCEKKVQKFETRYPIHTIR
jgi:hypothetical protein